ncbi:MAG: NUDIX domain-containing protein [Ruminococcaceae bacterium]|jgi:adenylylsulfate kinase/chloramphenicol 3-O phosphotransferase|nr:NUDIX domain-containing protein [Oscillospiraceae bacterium]
MMGRILFLYGLTSCGKTTVAMTMRKMSERELFVSSNDIFHDMVDGKFFRQDFWGEVARTIGAQYYAVRAMAEAGFDVAVDGMLLDLPEYREHFGKSNLELIRTLFEPFDPLLVRFDCPLEELRRRNLIRGDRGEFQSEEQARLMTKDPPADLVIDAMTTLPDEAAALILDAAGLPYHCAVTEEDRAELIRQILGSIDAQVRPGIGRQGMSRTPNLLSTEVRTKSADDTGKAVAELTRRGYRTAEGKRDFALLIRTRGERVTEICRISDGDGFDDFSPLIGSLVNVRIDRPAGSAHPEHPDLIYPIPYGFVPGLASHDGEDADAYLVGFPDGKTLASGDEVTGTVAAAVHRADDREEKLIVTPPNVFPDSDEMLAAVNFTERFFLSSLILPDSLREKSCGSVVFRKNEAGLSFLLLRESYSGAWSFPKGHMKAGETPLMTAEREAAEETGLTLRPLGDPVSCSGLWQRTETYRMRCGHVKDVVYFLSSAPAGWEPVLKAGEIEESVWIRPGDDLDPYGLSAEKRQIIAEAAAFLNRQNK